MWHTVGQKLVDSKEKEAVLARAMRWRKEVRVHVYGLDVRHVPAHHVGQSLECQRRCHANVQCGAVLCVWLAVTLSSATPAATPCSATPRGAVRPIGLGQVKCGERWVV